MTADRRADILTVAGILTLGLLFFFLITMDRPHPGVEVAPGLYRVTDASQQNVCYIYRETLSCLPARTSP